MNSKNIAPSNYQDLLKTIAIFCMIIDHLGLFFFPQVIDLRIIGRISVPIFCFFAGYNFTTKPKPTILALGLLLMMIEAINFHIFANILISIYVGQYALYMMERYKLMDNNFYIFIICLFSILLTPPTCIIMDSGTIVVGFVIIGKLYRYKRPDPGFMILLSLSYILMIMNIFPFSFVQNFITSFMILGTCYVLNMDIHSRKIGIDLRDISRNVLIIYFVHNVIFIIIACNLPLFLHFYQNYLKV